MAVPKHKPSKARSRQRRSINSKVDTINLILCDNCGNHVIPHRCCLSCGHYRGKQIIQIN